MCLVEIFANAVLTRKFCKIWSSYIKPAVRYWLADLVISTALSEKIHSYNNTTNFYIFVWFKATYSM